MDKLIEVKREAQPELSSQLSKSASAFVEMLTRDSKAVELPPYCKKIKLECYLNKIKIIVLYTFAGGTTISVRKGTIPRRDW